jgi:predicted phosphodiesterase
MIDNQILIETINAYNETGSQVEAAKRLGIARSTLQNRLRQASAAGLDTLALKPVPPGHSIKGISTLYDANGNVTSQWVKTRTNEPSFEDIAEYFKDALSIVNGKSEFVPPPSDSDEDLLNIYPIADLHVGMLAWGEETGEDFDIKIVEQLVYDSFEKLFQRSPNSKTALILNLGDYYHTNDFKNMTPASGNILDVDTRYQKMIYVGARIMKNVIERALEKHETVVVRNVAGNHDPASIVALNLALSMFYSNIDRVIVEDSPKQLWAMSFGNSLVGCHHGHKMKADRAAMALACDYSKEWGDSKYRVIYSGHFHNERVVEVGNVRCEQFQTLAAKDEYAASHGYSSGRSIQSITFHKELGEVGRSRVNI